MVIIRYRYGISLTGMLPAYLGQRSDEGARARFVGVWKKGCNRWVICLGGFKVLNGVGGGGWLSCVSGSYNPAMCA